MSDAFWKTLTRRPLLVTLSTTVLITAAVTRAATVTFQEGSAGYAGTTDTFLQQSAPATSRGGQTDVEWDGDDPPGSGQDNIALIRFDNIFGTNGPAQIPPGSQITSATLTYTVFNVGDDGNLYEVLVTWDESVTYNGFGGGGTPGVQPGEYGDFVATTPGSVTTHTVNVTTSLAAWSANPAANLGWLILPTASNGVQFRSSEYAGNPSLRPKLTVTYNEGAPTVTLVREPYLQRGATTEVTVVWRTDMATDSRVRFGPAPAVLDRTITDATATVDHVVRITSLDPDTKYYYDVGSTTQVLAGGDQDHYFATSPPVADTKAFTTWIVGDSGTGGSTQAFVRDAMLAETGATPPDIFVHVGDMAYSSGTDSQFTSNFFAPYQSILRHTVCWPTLGNHEGASSDSGTQTGPYYQGYVLPTAGEAGGLPSGTEAYYSFDHANAHFICLDSHDTNRAPGSAMLTWLSTDLAATDQAWLIAFWHHPPYTKGSHDSDNVADSGGRMRDMRENVLPILEAGGVDLVLAGHSHIYERSFLVDGAYDTPTTAAGHIVDGGDGRPSGDGAYTKSGGGASNDGAVYVVAGHGGTGVGGAGNHPLMFFSEVANGSCLLTIDRNVLSLKNVRFDGAVTDTFVLVKGANSGDCDADGFVDAADTEAFINCVAGPTAAPLAPACQCADLDFDQDADLADFAAFQGVFSN